MQLCCLAQPDASLRKQVAQIEKREREDQEAKEAAEQERLLKVSRQTSPCMALPSPLHFPNTKCMRTAPAWPQPYPIWHEWAGDLSAVALSSHGATLCCIQQQQ